MNLLDRLKQNGHRIPAFHLTVRSNPKKSTGGTKDITTLLSQRLMNLTLTDSRGFEADQLDFTLFSPTFGGQIILWAVLVILLVAVGVVANG